MKQFLVMVLGLAFLAGTAAAELEGFHKTYAEAQKQAKETGKPMYLHFTTTWCGWCRKIEQDCYAAAEGKKALEKYVPATLDCTVPQGQQPSDEVKTNLELMRKFGGRGYPFLVILTPEGELVNAWAGYKPLPDFVKELDEVTKTFQEYKDFTAYAATADKKSLEYNNRAMKLYTKMGQWAKAAEAAAEIRTLDPKDEKGLAAECVGLEIKAAAADKQADEAKIKTLLEELKKLDPANEKGQLEKVMWELAVRSYGLSRTRDAEMSKARLNETVELLTQLLDKAKKLDDPQNPYGLMGFCLMTLGRHDEAEKAIEKGLAIDPNSPTAERLKGVLERIKQAKAKAAEKKGTAAPAPETK